MTDDPATIAKGLSKAQAKRLLDIHALNERGLSWASDLGSVRINTARATTLALRKRSLIWDDAGDACLTPLGIRVRDHFLAQREGGDG